MKEPGGNKLGGSRTKKFRVKNLPLMFWGKFAFNKKTCNCLLYCCVRRDIHSKKRRAEHNTITTIENNTYFFTITHSIN